MKGLLKGFAGGTSRKDKASSKNSKLVESMNLSSSQVLSSDQVKLGGSIGEGGFAKVYRCKLDGQLAVAKVISSEAINEEMTYLLTNECTIWSR